MEKEQELQMQRSLPRLTAWGGWKSQLTCRHTMSVLIAGSQRYWTTSADAHVPKLPSLICAMPQVVLAYQHSTGEHSLTSNPGEKRQVRVLIPARHSQRPVESLPCKYSWIFLITISTLTSLDSRNSPFFPPFTAKHRKKYLALLALRYASLQTCNCVNSSLD